MQLGKKWKISEMDILQTDLYQMFDKLTIELKQIYLSHFQENYQNQLNNSKQMENQIAPVPKVINFIPLDEEKKLQKHQIVDPNPENMLPSELRFFQKVKEEANSFQQQIATHNEEYTIERKDLNTKLQLNQDDPLNLVAQFLNEEINNQESLLKVDVIYNQKKQQVMALSQFKIKIKSSSNEISTIKTFPYINAEEKYSPFQHTYLKYNQQIGQEEINILKYGNKMLNSNIINAYMNYLMIEDEKQYFSLGQDQRTKYNRLFLFCSEFVTDCGIDQSQAIFQSKYLYVWLRYLDKFKTINYQFMLIYKKMGFVINQSNKHWYFVQVNFENKQIIIYDSIKKKESSYNNIVKLLEFLFQESINDLELQFKVEIENKFPQQQDNYSCGYYTCLAANYLSKQDKTFQNIANIKNQLRTILLKMDINDVKLIDFQNSFCC